MININLKKTTIFILFFILCKFSIFAQNFNIDYIGIVSSEIDQNMAKMTSDLYYTQLNEIQDFTINDKRSDSFLSKIPDKSTLSTENLSFYAEITKALTSDKWIAKISVVNPIENNIKTKTIEYDSFYKILMESKNTLQETIKNLINEEENTDYELPGKKLPSDTKITSTENLSGTWSGEEFTDRIIIMRGGRGFIIFSNGASMTISVSLINENNSQKVIIKQNGHSNASFYPNLPRNIAVNAALEAEPLEWSFIISDSNTLTGTKKALIQKDESFTYSTQNAKWERVR